MKRQVVALAAILVTLGGITWWSASDQQKRYDGMAAACAKRGGVLVEGIRGSDVCVQAVP